VIGPGTTQPAPRSGTEPKLARRAELHDLFSTLLLSLATILTAWSAFQAAAWSDEQNKADEGATTALIESARASSRAAALGVIDLTLWDQWVNDIRRERDADPSLPMPGPRYVPTPGSDSAFTYGRFREEFVPAFERWLAGDPFVDPDAPSVPIVLPEYQVSQEHEANVFARKARILQAESDDEGDTTRAYVSLTVIYASVLALAALAVKLKRQRSREMTLGVSGAIFVGATIFVLTLPISF